MRELEHILTAIRDCGRCDLYLDKTPLNERQYDALSSVLIRRLKGEPLQYIMGFVEFMGLRFSVNHDVLIPRPETELLVEKAVEYASATSCRNQAFSMLDIGTGSGNIAVSLARFLPTATITATDVSEIALTTARDNARTHGVEGRITFIKSDVFSAISGDRSRSACRSGRRRFDMIVSNPPYIPSQDIDGLPCEVRQEPRRALDGGSDGLAALRRIIIESPQYLKEGGLLLLEMGYNQERELRKIVRATKQLRALEVIRDYRRMPRIMIVRRLRHASKIKDNG